MQKFSAPAAFISVIVAIALYASDKPVRYAAASTSHAGRTAAAESGVRGPSTRAAAAPVLPRPEAATAVDPRTVEPRTVEAAPGSEVPAQADAVALLKRASAAYGRVRSMTASFVQVVRNPLLGSTTTSRGSMFERRPDRFLMRFSQPAGDVLVGDGRYFWVYYPSVDPKQVVRMPASAAGQGVDLQAQFLGDPEKRFNARLQGREAVAGRAANVLHLVPRTQESYKELTVWLDARDNLARRFEIVEQNGSVRRFDLSNLRVNVSIPASTFRFTPPAGAHIVVR